MTTNFYAPPSAIRGQRIVLPEDEARHVRSVLRAEEGDEIVVVDGEGGWYRTRIAHAAPQQVVGTVVEERREVGEPEGRLTIGLGLLTKRRRFETFVEKAVELGVSRIVPLHTRHTEAETIRADRLRNVMIAALKQCRRSRLPTLESPTEFETLLEASGADHRLICTGEAAETSLSRALPAAETARTLVMVGPEGGFAEHEIEAAAATGCVPVSLGERRLRAETAGIAVASAAMIGRQGEATAPERPGRDDADV